MPVNLDSTARVPLDASYAERVYAGVLGKVIGVYAGRPIEGWTYEAIAQRFGTVDRFVSPEVGEPTVRTDDDITGTFTFIRALEDHGGTDVTAQQIGETWLNYLLEDRTVVWWGGVGFSTEHTAYARLKSGISAPESGSRQLNTRIVSEQIGGQIFIDGWGLVNPGDPDRAAELARRAASVSHDGLAVDAAIVLAAMVAEAFVDPDSEHLQEVALSMLPTTSLISRIIRDVRDWHARDPLEWRSTRRRIEERYGPALWGGAGHVVPNHALIHLGLLHGDGDFDRSMTIINTAGWDTDCNAGNLGCLVGVQRGLDAIGSHWRAPLADRMFVPTADCTSGITDAAQQADRIVAIARTARGERDPRGPRFHFRYPGSLQGFSGAPCTNDDGALTVIVDGEATVTTATFIPPDARAAGFEPYPLLVSPTLYSGQTVTAIVEGTEADIVIDVYDSQDGIQRIVGDGPVWTVPDTLGQPIVAVGVRLRGTGNARVLSIDWHGTPSELVLRPAPGAMLRRAWVAALSQFIVSDKFHLVQNQGRGMASIGDNWRDLRVECTLEVGLATTAGVALRVGGVRRYHALLLSSGEARLITCDHGRESLLARIELAQLEGEHDIVLQADGDTLSATVDGMSLGPVAVGAGPSIGAIALLVDEGHVSSPEIRVYPPREVVGGLSPDVRFGRVA